VTKTVSIRGSVGIGGDCGCGGSSGGPGLLLGLLGSCGDGLLYETAISAPGVALATVGSLGQNWADVGLLDSFTSIELLALKSSAKIRLRIDPTRPALTGSISLPSGGVTSGAATFTVTDETGEEFTAAVTFSGSTTTPELVVAAINAAFGAAGTPQPPDTTIASLDDDFLVLTSPGLGPLASVQLDAGAPADLGLGTAAVTEEGTSFDEFDIEGLFVKQFPRYPGAPTKIQVSGTASIDFVVAGRTSA
jgi:hypothetical protein